MDRFMINLEEKKKFVRLHAKAQGMSMVEFEQALTKIDNDAGVGKGNWCEELSNVAKKYFSRQDYSDALHYYNLARFPFIDSAPKKEAYKNCIISFNEWCKQKKLKIERLIVEHENTHIPFYFYKNKNLNAPLLLIMGGIVSIKEQWYQFLQLGKLFNFSVALIDFPGVGENPLDYKLSSTKYITKLLDSLARYINIENTHCVVMSFSGNMLLKLSTVDSRIKSIITVGAPIYHSFTDKVRWEDIPKITKMTLLKITRTKNNEELFEHLTQFELEAKLIRQSTIPLCYISSHQDEIISPKEKDYLIKHHKNLFIYSFNDEHGSPRYMNQIKNIILYSLLKFSNKKYIFRNLLNFRNLLSKVSAVPAHISRWGIFKGDNRDFPP